MKKIININLSSRLIPIEDSAYDSLNTYLISLKSHFSREEGGDEIVSDIENRIAEVFQDKLKKGRHCITDEDVEMMINTMGRIEQLEEEITAEPQEKQGRGSTLPPLPESKRLVRDGNDKVLGGVCAGVAAYLNIDPAIVRVLTFLLACVWGVGFIVYIVLWIVLPAVGSVHNPVRKRLYRNPDSKVVGGVCSGIAAYLNIDPVIPRIIFVLPLLGIIFSSILNHHWFFFPGFFFPLSIGFLPTLIVLYIILWISVPNAITVTEKLEMRGERVDLQAITNAVKGNTEEKKTEGTTVAQDPSVTMASSDISVPYYLPPKQHSRLGDLILLVLKIIGVIILAFILIVLCIALISVAGGFMGAAAFSSAVFPFKGLLLNTSLQHVLAWPATFLTLGIPVVAIIWLLIKLITGFRPKNNIVGISLSLLWVAGIICAIWLSISLVRDFRMNFREASKVKVSQPTQGKLIIRHSDNNISISGGWSMFGDALEIADDTVIINNVRLRIEKSPTDSFQVELIRSSNGYSVGEARSLAEALTFGITQQDSVLFLQKGISLSQGQPFRNQRLTVKIMVPVGKEFIISDEPSMGNWNTRWNNVHWDNDWEWGWEYNIVYKMTEDGPKKPGDKMNPEEKPEKPEPPEAPEKPEAPERDTYHYKAPRQETSAPDLEDAGDNSGGKTISLDGFSTLFYSLFNSISLK